MTPNPFSPSKPPLSRALVRVGLPLIILASAVAVTALLMGTKPRAEKRPPTDTAPLVRWEAARKSDHPVTVTAMGTVLAASQIELAARVGGQVEWISSNLIPGGRFKKGEPLLKLDKADLTLALDEARGKVQQARADLALEQGNQDVAQKELALMEATTGHKVKNQALALRKPQLAKAKANLALAAADLDKALLDLSRSELHAPFDGLVISRSAPVGTLVAAGQKVATLVADAAWWVEATLPVADLAWLTLPGPTGGPGSRARILTRNGAAFDGHLLQILGDLSADSRMARILIEVPAPMKQAEALNAPPLLLNSYVNVELQGKHLKGVIPLPDRALRDGSEIWVADGDTLRIRSVRVAWREGATLFVDRGLAPGERVILSDLSAPADGMKIRTGEKKEKSKGRPPAARG